MNCPKCGSGVSMDANFCLNCGHKLKEEAPVYNTQTKNKLVNIISVFFGIMIILTTCFFVYGNKDVNKYNTRTIMLYAVGSNLESTGGILTSDLESLDAKEIDLKKFNILLYTGGTTKWKNDYIQNDQNGLYIFTENGFELIEAQKQLNMGNAGTLTSFLNYAYNNYPADNYDLVFWDHGGALDGALYDDFSNDNLSLEEMKKALEASPFNEDNKLQTMLFRTCLNATLEVANVYKDYANYLIASEETSYGMSPFSVLNFLNKVKLNDDGKEYGIKFLDAYEEQMKQIDSNNAFTHTYSILDLSKVDEITNLLDEYVSGIDLDKKYVEVSKIRAELYQYASTSPSYDTVDLYQFVNSTKSLSSVSADKLLKAIKDAIIDNYNNDNYSMGLSVYFPYGGTHEKKQKYLSVYPSIGLDNKYYSFIKSYYESQKKPDNYNYDLESNDNIDTSKYKTEFSIELTDEQVKNYASSHFALFQRNKDYPDYFYYLLRSDRTSLNGNKLTMKYENDLIAVVENDEESNWFLFSRLSTKGKKSNLVGGLLYNKSMNPKDPDFDFQNYFVSGDIYFTNKNGVPVATTARLSSNNEKLDGSILDLNIYSYAEIITPQRKPYDEKGELTNDIDNWEASPLIEGTGITFSEFECFYSSLNDENEYFALVFVKDIYGDTYLSKVIRLGN